MPATPSRTTRITINQFATAELEGLARLDHDTSNELFEVLADWNTVLEHQERKAPVPPCP